jgi:hypothetical protein
MVFVNRGASSFLRLRARRAIAQNVKLGDARPLDEPQDIGLAPEPSPCSKPVQASIVQFPPPCFGRRRTTHHDRSLGLPVEARVRQARVLCSAAFRLCPLPPPLNQPHLPLSPVVVRSWSHYFRRKRVIGRVIRWGSLTSPSGRARSQLFHHPTNSNSPVCWMSCRNSWGKITLVTSVSAR